MLRIFLILSLLHDTCVSVPQEPVDIFSEISGSTLETAIAIFSQSVYVHMTQNSKSDNFAFSPLCLHSCLSMLYLGTTDGSRTERELGQAMGIINNKNLVKTLDSNVGRSYMKQKSLTFGSHGWMDKSLNVTESYRDLMMKVFGAGISQTDFSDSKSTDKINKWISDLTNNKITKLVDSLSPSTKLFLANAVYFKEKWLEPFEDTDVLSGKKVEGEFETDTGKISVPMMFRTSSIIRYGEIKHKGIEFDVVAVPYENENFEMQFIIPKQIRDFYICEDLMMQEVMRDRQVGNVNDGFNLFSAPKFGSSNFIDEVNLKIPKFKVNSKFDAANALKMMGVNKAFGSGAELDKFVSGGPIALGKVISEAFVEVTKNGTEATAATGVELVLLSASPGSVKNIIINKPFIFIVQDTLNNIPLLAGRIKNPKSP